MTNDEGKNKESSNDVGWIRGLLNYYHSMDDKFGKALILLGICAVIGFICIFLYALQAPYQMTLETGATNTTNITNGQGAANITTESNATNSTNESLTAAIPPLTALDSLWTVLSIFGAGALVAGSSFFIGGLLGFLFGIPQTVGRVSLNPGGGNDTSAANTRQENTEEGRYKPNTNLEDISDWLTKIIIGVGLVELTQVPRLLNQYAEMIAPALGGIPSSGAFGIAILVYYSVIGFLFVYVGTRAYMELGLEEAYRKEKERIERKGKELDKIVAKAKANLTDLERSIGEKQAKDDEAVMAVTGALQYDEQIEGIDAIIKAASRNGREMIFDLVRDKTRDRGTMENTIPILRALIACDENKLEYYSELGMVLSNKTNPDFEGAEKIFTDAIMRRNNLNLGGYLELEGGRAIARIRHYKGKDKTWWDENPKIKTDIINDINASGKECYAPFLNNEDLKNWMEKNQLVTKHPDEYTFRIDTASPQPR